MIEQRYEFYFSIYDHNLFLNIIDLLETIKNDEKTSFVSKYRDYFNIETITIFSYLTSYNIYYVN